MQIEPKTSANLPALPSTRPVTSEQPAYSSRKEAASETIFVPTVALIDLLVQFRQLPEIRHEAVQQAQSRLASGELDTPAATAETARAILSVDAPSN